MKNKRANIPITILVIGVLLICGMALLSFSISIGKVNELSAVSVLEKIKVQKEKMDFYKKIEVDFPDGEFDIKIEEEKGEKPERKYLFMQEGNIEVRFYLP